MAELAHLIPQVAMVLHYLHAAASLEKDNIYYFQNSICIMQSIYSYYKNGLDDYKTTFYTKYSH